MASIILASSPPASAPRMLYRSPVMPAPLFAAAPQDMSDLVNHRRIVTLLLDEALTPDYMAGAQKGGDMAPEHRDEMAGWLAALNRNCHQGADMLLAALSLVDQFLAATKVQPKHLRVVGAACLSLAMAHRPAKAGAPARDDLVALCADGFTASDLTRMEALVTDKLATKDTPIAKAAARPTAMTFLQALAPAVLACFPGAKPDAALLVGAAAHYDLLAYRGSTVALAAVRQALDACAGPAAAAAAVAPLLPLFATTAREVDACRAELAATL